MGVGGCSELVIADFQDYAIFVYGFDVAHMPVLDFQTPQAVTGVKNEEIRVAAMFAIAGDVIPNKVTIIEVVAQ